MPLGLNTFNDEMAALVEEVQRSLVQIVGERGSLGAGTIWHSDGLVVTNAHVVQGRKVEVVLPDGAVHKASLVAQDDQMDIAALAIDAAGLPTINVGDSHGVRAGQWVIAVGHPFGVLGSATAGTVITSGVGLADLGGDREWIALNLRLRPGHSGGPLVDVQGRLIGVNTLITGPEVGFAIPSHIVTQFLKEHISGLEPAAV